LWQDLLGRPRDRGRYANRNGKGGFIMAERLAVDVSRTYESGMLGKRGDDKFPCNGTRITRVEFHKEISSKSIDVPAPSDLPGTLKQKISGCFRSADGAKMFCRIRGYLSTLRKQDRNVLDALVGLFSGKPEPLLPQPE
jgi:hypothetical protein